MNFILTNKNQGITLVEAIVAAFISLIVIVAIYSFFSHSTYTALLAKAKGEAKQIAETILRQIERDIATSKVNVKIISNGNKFITKLEPSLKITDNNFEMIVPEVNSWMKIEYQFTPPYLYRIASHSKKTLSENVKDFKICFISDEQLTVEVKVELYNKGIKEPIQHHQSLLITLQEAIKYKLDPKWRSNNEDILNSY